MRSDRQGQALVVAQFACLAGLCWPGRPRWSLPAFLMATTGVGVGIGAGLAGSAAMQLGADLHPAVQPKEGALLRTDGPYAFSRNPLYVGLMIAAMNVAVLRRRPEPLLCAAALGGVLFAKVVAEEQRLREHFGAGYADYVARTPRLLGLPQDW